MASPMKKLSDDVIEALTKAGDEFASALQRQSRRQRQKLLDIVEETRRRDSVLAQQRRPDRDGPGDVDDVDTSVDADGLDVPPGGHRTPATFGDASSNNYRDNFFEENPDADPSNIVHHAVEQATMDRYPDLITPAQMHSPENLRGIPEGINSAVHLSAIRKMWNQFYTHYGNLGRTPTQAELLDYATLIDDAFGDLFDPPVR
ncbi:hypothetical protein [Microbacterium sp.]|uniref:hypothetical protein n=1 Tax=Microbacterium sp. TaxID=51671 RepID=UPI002810DD77|nr:hypothetical protein [Microbacterium sp.]